jgi:molybdopterin molybdotransferase
MAPLTIAQASCADDYDPDSMPVAKAREFIHQFLQPLGATLRVPIRSALGRVLAEDVLSPVDVPAHRNSAMDGWALRGADLERGGETTLAEIGASFAGRPFCGSVGPGQCVRIMTGGVVPAGADTVVMQERAKASGKSVTFAPGQMTGQNVREAGEDLAKGSVALRRGRIVRPADLGLIASLGIGEVAVYRPLRVAFFSTGDELKSVGTQLGEGEIYDSNRYTLFGMLQRLGCDVLDMGVVRDEPALLEHAFAEAAASADVVITSGGVSVGEADFVKAMLDRLGEVVFWKIAMKPGRPLAYGKIKGAHFFGLPGNPVSVMVTFYQFVRDALLVLSGAHPVEPVPTFNATCTARLKKAPGRTEFQRGILARGADGELNVRPTGEQGSGILKSMSEANCFIILGDATGNVEPGTSVEVQLLEGLV